MIARAITHLLILAITLAACGPSSTPSIPSTPLGLPGAFGLHDNGIPPAITARYQLTIAEVAQGPAADQLMAGVIQAGRLRPQGYTWLLLRLTGICDQAPPDGSYLTADTFHLFAAGRQVDMTGIDYGGPRPHLTGRYLAGAQLDGWLTLAYPAGATDLRLLAGDDPAQTWYTIAP